MLARPDMPPSRSPLASSRLAVVALFALAGVACGANVAAPASTTSTGAVTTTGAGGGSSSSCPAPRVDRAESGACAKAGRYGVDEGNPMCCRPCAADEVVAAVPTPGGSAHCVKGQGGAGGAAACAVGDPAWKACGTADDCAWVALGCYCGVQPVVGVAKTVAEQAAACEQAAAQDCMLGCPNAPGHQAEDGHEDVDGGAIAVRCNGGLCTTVIE